MVFIPIFPVPPDEGLRAFVQIRKAKKKLSIRFSVVEDETVSRRIEAAGLGCVSLCMVLGRRDNACF